MKNLFLSAWLSGANRVLSAARGVAASEMGRQRAAALRALVPKTSKPPTRKTRTPKTKR